MALWSVNLQALTSPLSHGPTATHPDDPVHPAIGFADDDIIEWTGLATRADECMSHHLRDDDPKA